MARQITLRLEDETVLLKADSTPIVNAMSALSLGSANSWLPAGHPAENGIEKEHAPGQLKAISEIELAEYLAIAAPNHCADGWGYLSRALNAYLSGDAHSSWHFAYYAELRAAQSILSGLGCGAFNSWNCVLDSAGKIHKIPSKDISQTHTMVWLALDFLADQSQNAATTLADATKTLGESLPSIVRHAYPGRSFISTSSGWIRSWILDLRSSSADKGFRNKCSYNPHISTPHRADIRESIDLVAALWQILEPTPGAAFFEVDKEIVRGALRIAANESLQLRGIDVTASSVEQELEEAYSRIVAAAPMFRKVAEAFIIDSVAIESPLLTHAKDTTDTPDTPRPALSRATLLLRIASGLTENLLRNSGQNSNLAFWLDALAMQQGIIKDQSEIPENRSDLYNECIQASRHLEDQIANGVSNRKQALSRAELSPYLAANVERVVQWGFGT